MLVDPTNIPQNSNMPVPRSQVEWDAYVKARALQAGMVGQLSYQCSSPTPQSFESVPVSPSIPSVQIGGQSYDFSGIVDQVGTQKQAAQLNLLTRSNAVGPGVTQQGQAGAIISDDQIAGAPTVVPMNTVPSMLPVNENTIAAKQERQARLHPKRQAGTPWGVPAAVSKCGSGQGLSLWAKLFIAGGLGVIAYAAVKD